MVEKEKSGPSGGEEARTNSDFFAGSVDAVLVGLCFILVLESGVVGWVAENWSRYSCVRGVRDSTWGVPPAIPTAQSLRSLIAEGVDFIEQDDSGVWMPEGIELEGVLGVAGSFAF